MGTGQLGNYQLIKKLATGGMAEVWLARQSMGAEGVNRHVVVKRILPHLAEDPEFVQMFLNEARIAAKFSHPNIAQIFDFGEKDDTFYIAMEFIHGEDLGRLMRKAWSTGQWIARPLAIRIVASACEGLYYAHTRKDEEGRALKVVHRDISPQNILISFDGTVKLVDFGIAKAADQSSMTKSGAIKGKFAYMAPEQAAGKPLDARTDVFALGLVLYELLTGVRPLKRDSELATLQAALECAIDAPSIVAEVPAELDDVVMRALAKAPDDRYKDARAFQMALEEFLIGQRLVATSVQVSELMETLFADRRAEEDRLGAPNPSSQESMSASPAVPEPPGWEPSSRNSNVRQHSVNTDAARPGEAGREEQPEEQEWEAPPAVQPSRRYSNPNSTSIARGSGSQQQQAPIEQTRARPPTREAVEAVTGEAVRPSRMMQARKSSVAPRVREDEPEAPEPEPLDDDPPMATPARRTNSGKLKRTQSKSEMPEAPPRRSRPGLQALDGGAGTASGSIKKKSNASLRAQQQQEDDERVDVTGLKQVQASRMRGVIAVVALAALGILAFVFKGLLPSGVVDGNRVPILLTVTTNPTTRVRVIPPDRAQQPLDLGATPIYEASGVYVGDTIELSNNELCIQHTETINFGEPNKVKALEKKFEEGQLVVQVKPPGIKALGVFCNGQKIGDVGLQMRLPEGNHKLEIRGDALRAPLQFEASVEPGAGKKKSTVSVDLTPVLDR